MNPDAFAAQMRECEVYRELRVPTEQWAVLRMDGRGFSRLTEAEFAKPFDPRFHEAMLAVARALLSELGGVYAYTESDEVSLVLEPGAQVFGRRVEKLVSIGAGIASAVFTRETGALAHFDARVWTATEVHAVVDYLRWRQADALRCSLSGLCYWTLRGEGLDARAATAALAGSSREDKEDLLAERGCVLSELPGWQRQGSAVFEETYAKQGFDPRRGVRVDALRRRLRVEGELPTGDAYGAFLRERLAG